MDERRKGTCIRIAGNTDIPALLALRAKGYRVWLEYMKIEDPNSPWHPYMPDYQAEKDGAYFSATNPVELLGLVVIWETRGMIGGSTKANRTSLMNLWIQPRPSTARATSCRKNRQTNYTPMKAAHFRR